jgi:hypothetical protein
MLNMIAAFLHPVIPLLWGVSPATPPAPGGSIEPLDTLVLAGNHRLRVMRRLPPLVLGGG